MKLVEKMRCFKLLSKVCFVVCAISTTSDARENNGPVSYLSDTQPFYQYQEFRTLFPFGHTGFPIKYQAAQVKINKKNPRDFLKQDKYQIYLGPLGLKCIMHDKTFVHSGAHRSIFPTPLTDNRSNLAYSCFEVRQLLPNSPAAGKVKVGDLVFMINGQSLKSGQEMFPEAKYSYMRQLLHHTAELLDDSESTGVAELKILRLLKCGGHCMEQNLIKTLHTFKLAKPGSKEEVTIPLDGIKTIHLVNSDTDHHSYLGDTIWVNPRFIGPKGELLLKDLDWKWRSEMEFGIQMGDTFVEGKKWDTQGNVFQLSPNNQLVYTVPEGYDTFKVGVISTKAIPGKVRIETSISMKWSSALNNQIVDVKIPITQYGKLGKTFPDHCEKSQRLARSYVDFLLEHQRADGTWQRWGGLWTSSDFDTSIVGLALLSMGDKQLSPQIKKAAYAVATSDAVGWATVTGTKILFLSEYYLRTKDKGILPHLQQMITETETTLMGDYYVGHSFENPGYNGKGMSVGFAYVLLGLSVASHTDATVNLEVLDGMHELCARLAHNNGGLPYGRFWNASSVPKVPWNAAARTGPPLAAAIISGGNKHFVEKSMLMFHATYGAIDKVHACPSMGLFGANLAFCLADRPFFQKSMAYYKWKFILNKYPHAGMLSNPHNMHRATGETARGRWWQTAAATILLNAGKKNMAITGQAEYRSRKFKSNPSPAAYFAQLFSKYKNDWTVAEEILGDQCPKELQQATTQLRNIETDSNIRKKLLHFLEQHAFKVADRVQSLKGIDNTTKSYALELILGVDHFIETSKRGSVSIHSFMPLGGLFARSDISDLSAAEKSRIYLKGKITIAGEGTNTGKNLTLHLDSTKLPPEEWKSGIVTAGSNVAWRSKETYTVPCRFEFNIGGIKVSYTRDITINNIRKETAISDLVINQRPVVLMGTLLRGGLTKVQSIQLKNGYQMDVLVPEGVDLLNPRLMGYPSEKGDTVSVEYCSNGINPHYRTMKMLKTQYTRKYPTHCKILNKKEISEEALKPIYDNDLTTNFQIKSRGTVDLEFTFDSPVSVSSVIGNYKGMLRAKKLVAFGWADGQWQDLASLAKKQTKVTRIKTILSSMTFNSAIINEIMFSGKD